MSLFLDSLKLLFYAILGSFANRNKNSARISIVIPIIHESIRKSRCLEDLVKELKRKGSKMLAANEIRIGKYKGKYWSVDNRRLYCLHEVFGGDEIITARYYFFVEDLSIKEFVRKWTTETDGCATSEAGRTDTMTFFGAIV